MNRGGFLRFVNQKIGAKAKYDDKKQNKVTYVKNGYNVVTWIEDTKSLGAKLDLVKEYDLIGAAYWVKDEETNDVWQLVSEKIGIK